MMLKLRKIGNSLGVLLPHNVITGLKEGDKIDINVITSDNKVDKVITSTPNVITNKENVYTSVKTEPFKSFFKK